MLDRKHTEAYNSVCAPKDFLDKILASDKTVKKSFSYRRFTAMAACILLALLILPLYAALTQPSVVLSDTPAVITARSADTQIALTLDLDRKTEVTVSDGILSGIESEIIKGKAELQWSFDPTVTEELKLLLKDIFGTKVYELCYNENNGSWSIVKK